MDRIWVTLITGFLGSGKTTILSRILRDPAFADTAVIVNEFGEVGLDHLLVEATDESIIDLSCGCICCTIRPLRRPPACPTPTLAWLLSFPAPVPALDCSC